MTNIEKGEQRVKEIVVQQQTATLLLEQRVSLPGLGGGRKRELLLYVFP